MLRIKRLHIALQELLIHILGKSCPGKMSILQHQGKLLAYNIIIRLSLAERSAGHESRGCSNTQSTGPGTPVIEKTFHNQTITKNSVFVKNTVNISQIKSGKKLLLIKIIIF